MSDAGLMERITRAIADVNEAASAPEAMAAIDEHLAGPCDLALVALLSLLDPAHLRIVAIAGAGTALPVGADFHLRLTGALSDALSVLAEGESVVVQVDEKLGSVGTTLAKDGIRRVHLLPLRRGSATVGALALGATVGGEPGDARQRAAAVLNVGVNDQLVRLLREANDGARNAQAEALILAREAVLRAATLHDALAGVAAALRDSFDPWRIHVIEFTAAGTGRFHAGYAPGPTFFEDGTEISLALTDEVQAIVGDLMLGRPAQIWVGQDDLGLLTDILAREGIVRGVAVPLRADEAVLAIMTLGFTEDRPFTEQELRFLQVLGAEVEERLIQLAEA